MDVDDAAALAWRLGRHGPPGRRAIVSPGAGLVTRDGVLSGTWRASGTSLTVSWFREAGAVPVAALERRDCARGRGAGPAT